MSSAHLHRSLFYGCGKRGQPFKGKQGSPSTTPMALFSTGASVWILWTLLKRAMSLVYELVRFTTWLRDTGRHSVHVAIEVPIASSGNHLHRCGAVREHKLVIDILQMGELRLPFHGTDCTLQHWARRWRTL